MNKINATQRIHKKYKKFMNCPNRFIKRVHRRTLYFSHIPILKNANNLYIGNIFMMNFAICKN